MYIYIYICMYVYIYIYIYIYINIYIYIYTGNLLVLLHTLLAYNSLLVHCSLTTLILGKIYRMMFT